MCVCVCVQWLTSGRRVVGAVSMLTADRGGGKAGTLKHADTYMSMIRQARGVHTGHSQSVEHRVEEAAKMFSQGKQMTHKVNVHAGASLALFAVIGNAVIAQHRTASMPS